MPGRQFSTHANNPESIDALHDGVPAWMKTSLDDWIQEQLARNSGYSSKDFANVELVQTLERVLRTSLTVNSRPGAVMDSIFYKMDDDENLKLDVVDGILQLTGTAYSGTESLENILMQSGSKWKVVNVNDNYSLQERVDSSVATAMDDLSSQGGDTSNYMTKAWNDAFGRNPNPSSAYSNCIKAIEAASWQIVTPNNSRATLGTIIREMTDHPDNFQVSLREKHANHGIDAIRQDMSVVWYGQTDRHGTSNPVSPSQEAAEQAIFIGLSLCQQFIRGLVAQS